METNTPIRDSISSGKTQADSPGVEEWWHPNERSSPVTPVPAPRFVRADELAAVLRDLQARGSEMVDVQQALGGLSGVIAPESVLEEVEARRLADEEAKRQQREREMGKSRAIRGAVGAVCVLATGLAARSVVAHYNDWSEERKATAAKEAEEARIAKLPRPAAPVRTTPVISYSLPFFRMSPTTKRFDAIKDGEDFRLEFSVLSVLQRALSGNSTTFPATMSEIGPVLIDKNPPFTGGMKYQVVKLNGRLYMRAWTLGRISPETLKAGKIVQDGFLPPSVTRYSADVMAQKQQELQAAMAMPKVQLYSTKAAALSPNLAPQPRTINRVVRDPDGHVRSIPTTIPPPPVAGPPIQVTIPGDAIGSSYSGTGSGSDARIETTVSRLDKHAYEKWTQLSQPVDNKASGTSVSKQ